MHKAKIEAKIMEKKYTKITGFILVLVPLLCPAIAEDTKTKTKIGAIAFKAETNKLPKAGKTVLSPGMIMAKITPKISPITTCIMNGIALKNLAIGLFGLTGSSIFIGFPVGSKKEHKLNELMISKATFSQ